MPTVQPGPVWIFTSSPQRTADNISQFKIWIDVDPIPAPGYQVTLSCDPAWVMDGFPMTVSMQTADVVVSVQSVQLSADPQPVTITATDGLTSKTRSLTL